MPDTLRSYLYAPGSRPDLMAKALRAGADAVVLDLEDAVAAGAKASAREAVAIVIAAADGGGPELHVRVNPAGDGFDGDDVRAVVRPGLAALRLPKAASPAAVRALAAALDGLEERAGLPSGRVRLYPTIESAAGVLAASELAAAPRVERLVFGATDFLADIGAPGAADGPATLTARGLLVLASRAAGIAPPVDSVHTALDDAGGLRRSALAARELGFFGKSVIHPRQLAVVHEAFAPTADEVARARQVLAAAGAAAGAGVAATTAGGGFVDAAVVARARAVLSQIREVDVGREN